MENQKIYLVCGLHVNYNHSWRGDANDRSGFGLDSKIINGVINILDEANEKGISARGTWDFDNFWSLESIMPQFAPDVLDGIIRRVKQGPDEAILGCWNNGDVGASTDEEFRENLKRTISNKQGSGIKDLFGDYTPAVRTQETMFTHGNIELYVEQGVDAIALYYSSVPFDAVKNFTPKLSPNEMYNLLTYRSTESDASMLMIPMYNQGDIVYKGSLKKWVKEIRSQQKKGEIPGDALLYINMDADAELWTGLGLPRIFDRVPNSRGLPEFIELVESLDYLEFGTIGDYLKNHESVGELTVRQDLADGSYTGYNSWTEKEVNQRLWRISERARWFERTADFISGTESIDEDSKNEIQKLLYDENDSYFENKIRLLSTTHFGMNSPDVHEDRSRVAFHLARKAYDFSNEALDIALNNSDEISVSNNEDSIFSFSLINQGKYRGETKFESGAKVFTRVPFDFKGKSHPIEKLYLKNDNDEEIKFDLIEYQTDDDGFVESGLLCFVHEVGDKAVDKYRLVEGVARTKNSRVKVGKTGLNNGIVDMMIDDRGRISSIRVGDNEFSDGQFMSLGVTYKIDRQRKFYSPRVYHVTEADTGPRGNLAHLGLSSRIVIFLRGKNYPVEAEYDIYLFDDLPYFIIDVNVKYPETPAEKGDISAVSRMDKKFDTNWFEVMPAELKPDIHNISGKHIRVWKHNFKNRTNYYDFNYGDIDVRNKNVDSCNNHLTDGWIAISNTEKGCLISCDSRLNSTPAYCPMRLREKDKVQSVMLNPFGTYFGKQFSHLIEGSGFAAELVRIVGSQHRPTAPSYNGSQVKFSMMVAPYAGDEPSDQLKNDADLYSIPPMIFSEIDGKNEIIHGLPFDEELLQAIEDHNLDACKGWLYADILEERNKGIKRGVPDEEQGASIGTFLNLIIEGIKMRP